MALPDDVRDLPLDEIKALMRDQYGETKTVAEKLHELFAVKQTAGQTIRNYAIKLRTLIQSRARHQTQTKEGNSAQKRDSSTDVASVVKPKEVKSLTAPPAFIQLQLQKEKADLELDSGADVSLVSENDWIANGKPKLSTCSGLHAYGGKPINVLGFFKSKDKAKNLCGRDLLKKLKIDLDKAFGIGMVQQIRDTKCGSKLDEVLQSYAEVFSEGLGRCKRHIALKFKTDVQPKRCKPRPVPFALRPELEKVINQWAMEGVLEPVATSDWATPLVIVQSPATKFDCAAIIRKNGKNMTISVLMAATANIRLHVLEENSGVENENKDQLMKKEELIDQTWSIYVNACSDFMLLLAKLRLLTNDSMIKKDAIKITKLNVLRDLSLALINTFNEGKNLIGIYHKERTELERNTHETKVMQY
ncbi:hypothetical protein niasHT_002918 [Heterodera trifolii]|uniref:Peptidase A2 domain-containing protein n=1 Tax=Heterodera trifolii TaxID=157864 RepID=A0ABD2LPB3_9BILA